MGTYEYHKSDEMLDLRKNMISKGIVPIIKDGNLDVYVVQGGHGLFNLSLQFDKEFYDLYDVLLLSDFNLNLTFDMTYNSYYTNMDSYKKLSVEKIHEMFKLDNEIYRDFFIKINQKDIEILGENNKKEYRKESFEEILERMSNEFIIGTFKRDSKLSTIINYIYYSGHFDLDFIMSLMYEFIYSDRSKNIGYIGINNEEQFINSINYTNKEKKLSEEKKYELLKDIYNCFSIECLYSKKFDDINDAFLKVIFDCKNREVIRDYALHNNEILETSLFAPIYKKNEEKREKVLIKK